MKYPEHEKLKAIQDQSQKCGEFYEWLQSELGIDMVQHFDYERDEDDQKVWRDSDGNIVEDYRDPEHCWESAKLAERYRRMRDERGIDCHLIPNPAGPIEIPIRMSVTQILAKFFDIDADKLEEEKQQMLEECRKAQEAQ